NSTVAPTIGFPSTPVAMPPTLARFCAQQLAAPSVTMTATAKIVNVFFMAFLLSQSRFLLLTVKLFPWRKRLDLRVLPALRRASAVRNSRKLRRPAPPGCNTTKLNRREQPAQARAQQSPPCAWQ